MKLRAVVDRFEEGKAVLLLGADEVKVVWPRCFLPPGAAEGDYLKLDFQLDRESTRAARQESEDLLRQLLGDTEK
ncbi:MAG: DUF3006 domain-containing protein [Sporomusaceae bacterium]|nr:DUF3006 domain-containing protein [Sporomusaceae bacterium]